MSARKRELPPICQAAAVAFRRRNGAVEVCLVTSLHKGKWVLPKGIIDPGDTPAETVLKECWEEAGVRGKVLGPPLGRYEDFKWNTELLVDVFVVEVEEVAETWPESDVRRREWFRPRMAARQVSKRAVKDVLKLAARWMEQQGLEK